MQCHVKRLLAVVALGVVALPLSGCYTSERNDDITHLEAKEEAQEVEMEIAGLFPGDDVVSIEQQELGDIGSCSLRLGGRTDPADGYRWSGLTVVRLEDQSGEYLSSVLEDIAEHFDGTLEPHLYTIDEDSELYDLLTLSGPHGSGFAVDYNTADEAVWISSGSQCFILPEDMSVWDQY